VPYHAVPAGGVEVRYWDVAATEKTLRGDDPDFLAGVCMRKVGDTYYVLDCLAVQVGPTEGDRLIRTTALRDRARLKREGDRTVYKVRWELQPAAAGKRDNRHLVRLLDGFDAQGIPPEGDKITRAKPLASQAEQGFVVLAEGEWNEGWLQHMHHQPDWPHDDILDASSGAHRALIQDDSWGATA
jgi:predicted phage terminase large subunit-like protein